MGVGSGAKNAVASVSSGAITTDITGAPRIGGGGGGAIGTRGSGGGVTAERCNSGVIGLG